MFTVCILSNTYSLVSASTKSNCIDSVLKILYSNDFAETDELVDFHFSQKEISILVPKRFLNLFQNFSYTEEYIAIRIDTDNPGLEEPGIIATLTGIIKEYNITILATSTFMCNYIFIPKSELLLFNKMLAEKQEFFRIAS